MILTGWVKNVLVLVPPYVVRQSYSSSKRLQKAKNIWTKVAHVVNFWSSSAAKGQGHKVDVTPHTVLIKCTQTASNILVILIL